MAEIDDIQKWRALLKELGAPSTEKLLGAIIMVRTPWFRADIYPVSRTQRWVYIREDGSPENFEGMDSFKKMYGLLVSPPEPYDHCFQRIEIPEELMTESSKQRRAEDLKRMMGSESVRMPATNFRDILKENLKRHEEHCRLPDEILFAPQVAPPAPPRKDPLRSYLEHTAKDRPNADLGFIAQGGILVDTNPRYAVKPELTFELDEDQKRAMAVIMDPVNRFVVLIGKAGTGKSTVVRALESKMRVAKTATTGRAAMNIDGITLDRLFSYDRTYDKTRNEKVLARNMASCPRCIVIDEASMIGLLMMNYLYRMATRFDKQLILVGDWAQASPVKDEWPVGSQLLQSAVTVKLTKVHRQAQGPYLEALDRIRNGTVDDFVRSVFQPCVVGVAPDDDRCIRMFATNKLTDAYNAYRLNVGNLAAKNPVQFHATLEDLRSDYMKTEYPMEPENIQRILDDSPFATYERFKAGARVIVTMNARVDDVHDVPPWVNGDQGELVCFQAEDGASFEDPGVSNPFSPTPIKVPITVVVRLDRGGEITIPYQVFTAEEPDGTPIYSITGMPIQLGWACTIHRCIDTAQLVPTVGGMTTAGDLIRVFPSEDMQPLPSLVPLEGSTGGTAATHGWVSADEQDGYQITTRCGYTLTCGEKHRIAAWDGSWRRVSSLKVGDQVLLKAGPYEVIGAGQREYVKCPAIKERWAVRGNRKVMFPSHVDEDMGYFLGVCVGDSNHTDQHEGRIEISDEHQHMVKWCEDYVIRSFGVEVTWLSDAGFYWHSVDVRDTLAKLGLTYARARGASIPSSVLASPPSVVRAFLRGLFDADGGVNNDTVHLTSASRRLINEVQQVLLAFYGVQSSQGDVNANRRLMIMGRNVKLFQQHVGFNIPVKVAKLEAFAATRGNTHLPKSNLGQLPGAEEVARLTYEIMLETYSRPYGAKRQLMLPGGDPHNWGGFLQGVFRHKCARGKKTMTYAHLRALMIDYPEVKWEDPRIAKFTRIAKHGGFVEEIREIKKVRCKMVDVTVPGDHAYVAGGFINHNSQGLTVDQAYVDMDSILAMPGDSRHGLAYVAMSRTRTLEGLKLSTWNDDAVFCAPLIKQYI